ncbi:unnamed protein product [Rotaria magnacalcarata]|uniref:Steroid 5-alpha reductase C-terminal domain-containing protein n=2 Tax=Rotaria magnacalcarata TaxID=392030 RepID=A0A817A189_9BILA|nr:unnamed protein product [Rotaria magnacalcarata]CAF2236918.1 unnamed protein product [Rotaria magnacalcarata]CAF3831197.1 unnamed protein product [Rotaria magnacalcarata]CAF4146757.1 unnamed protein product [Rotaria magnacalcarata]CAF4329505.1 unnamed protein product [Rotaria magnacalcarata]
MSTDASRLQTIFNRSDKSSHPLPRFLFAALRAVDPYLQYMLIFNGYGSQILSQIGIDTISAGPKGTVLVAMAAGCALKQLINMAYILEIKIDYAPAIGICFYNTLSNSLASLSCIYYGPSNELGTIQYVGISLFTVGILTELISELQRKRFKDQPANKGKLYTGGLFSLARHINYGGYALWRTGIALTSGSYWLGAFQFIWHLGYFTKLSVPDLAGYCSKKYGDDWKKFERDTPSILFPYIW